MSARAPEDARVYRITHVDNLDTLMRRDGLHAPNFVPADCLPYRSIHRPDIQAARMTRAVPCGPGGVLLDYIPFFFGPRPPMLYQLHTGWVPGHSEGQEPLIYLVSTVRRVAERGASFVFTDGHALAAYTSWYDDLHDLGEIDWTTVASRYWASTADDLDRQRRKQAEFLVHRFLPWDLIDGIAVASEEAKERVRHMLAEHPAVNQPKVAVARQWYYE